MSHVNRRSFIKTTAAAAEGCVVGDRADSYGADGGNLSLEIRAALQQDPENKTVVLSRIYGLGGKEFYEGLEPVAAQLICGCVCVPTLIPIHV